MQQFDVVWYGRAAAWVGAALILLMAVTGRQVALVTVAAVLGLIIGMALLLYSIPGGRVRDADQRDAGFVRGAVSPWPRVTQAVAPAVSSGESSAGTEDREE